MTINLPAVAGAGTYLVDTSGGSYSAGSNAGPISIYPGCDPDQLSYLATTTSDPGRLYLPEDDVARAAAELGFRAGRSVDERAASTRAIGSFAGHQVDLSGGLALPGPGGALAGDFALLRRAARLVPGGGATGARVAGAPAREISSESIPPGALRA